MNKLSGNLRVLWRGWTLGYGLLFALLSGSLLYATPSSGLIFSRDVAPIFQQNCLSCHGTDQPMSQLDLRTRAGMLQGGLRGPALVPGQPNKSRIYQMVAGEATPSMPLDGNLNKDEISTLAQWINEGASWDIAQLSAPAPTLAKTKNVHSATNYNKKEITAGDRNWWSFQQPTRRLVPEHDSPRWNRNPIDAFIKERLDIEGLEPAPRANKQTLIRRASLDLLGLLPSREEVEKFVQDASPNAFEKLIDRLLTSPHYGERWGRHWLDVARYADSGGYEHDFDYPNSWRYRDYVVRAFNEDKPYTQFIREQLAGDELDEVTNDSLIATGFNRVGPTVGHREKDNPQYRYNYLDDMIGTTSRAFMGLTVNCARCHDHKFDPITQHDYYSMLAIFFPFVNYEFALADSTTVREFEMREAAITAKIKPLRQQIDILEAPYRKLALEKKLESFPVEIQQAVEIPEDKLTEGQKLLVNQVNTMSVDLATVKDRFSLKDQEAMDTLKRKIAELEKQMPAALPRAMAIRDGDYRFSPDGSGDQVAPGKGDRENYGNIKGSFLPQINKEFVPPTAYFLPTGDYRTKGYPIEPGFLQVLAKGDERTAIPPSRANPSSGRRRALAEWITSPNHPLTARVMINRLWHFHFGRGIVNTPSNFGRTGSPPIYPKLLDWLAIEFLRNDWSIKDMHRLVMNSETYQMASVFDHPQNREKDPAEKYLWRFPERRLEAEIIRDLILDASGKLNRKIGGRPFFPPIPETILLSFPRGKWTMNDPGPAVWRRSIYSYWKRGLRYPMFEVFDQPNPNVTCEGRNRTTVPTQALTLLNNKFVLEQAKHFADRIATEVEDVEERIRHLYLIALSRNPDRAELEKNLSFLKQQTQYHLARGDTTPKRTALVDLCNVILNLSEFVYIN
ncbi:MAG: hypothetical protein CMN58_01280 [Solibacterales bacterium]|nr:hypothetical protein [Bryobacterales bacterium]